MELEKVCTKCGRSWPRTKKHFHMDNKNRDGLRGRCKLCVAKSDHKRLKRAKRVRLETIDEQVESADVSHWA